MTSYAATVPFDSGRHDTAAFRCGQEPLDRWLQVYAGQSQRRDAARTFVTASDAGAVLGYYTLVAGQIEHISATTAVRRGMSRRFPIPVALIARLAVHAEQQGRGLGRSLLLDALRRVVHASDELAVRAIVVSAIDDRAVGFYTRFGFQPSALGADLLMVPMDAVRQVLAAR